MGAAAAEIADERGADIGLVRPWIAVQQFLRRQDHATGAVAALGCLLLDERLLEHVRLVDRAETFEGRDLARLQRTDRYDAGAHRSAVDQHGAGPALRQPAAILGAIEFEIVADRK